MLVDTRRHSVHLSRAHIFCVCCTLFTVQLFNLYFSGQTMKTCNVLQLNYVFTLFVTWIKAETVHLTGEWGHKEITGLNNKTRGQEIKPSTDVTLHSNIVIVPFSNSNTGEAKRLFSILIILHLCVQCRM